MITREGCLALDDSDPLAHLRDEFLLPEGVVYLDGNSLGPLSTRVADRIDRVVRSEWGEGLIRSWNAAGWIDLPRQVGDKIGRLVGAEPGTIVACDSTSVNLFKAVAAAVSAAEQRAALLTDAGNFPTDIYVMRTVAERSGLELRVAAPDALIEAITSDVGLVAVTQVDYRTGRRHDMGAVNAAARRHGVLTVWDLAHSAGAFPVDLSGTGSDYAVGCGYKYLNGGPGAPGFIYVSPSQQASFRNPITAWFGHVAPFDFDLEFRPAPGIDRARVGTSHVISLAGLDAALDIFEHVHLGEVEAKSQSLTQVFIELCEEMGLDVVTPREFVWRGSQVSLRHPDAYPIVQALISQGVIGDFRAPDIARFGFAPLYLRHADIFDAAQTLADIMERGTWRDPRFSLRQAVT